MGASSRLMNASTPSLRSAGCSSCEVALDGRARTPPQTADTHLLGEGGVHLVVVRVGDGAAVGRLALDDERGAVQDGEDGEAHEAQQPVLLHVARLAEGPLQLPLHRARRVEQVDLGVLHRRTHLVAGQARHCNLFRALESRQMRQRVLLTHRIH